MPPRREVLIHGALVGMDILAGFSLVLGANLLQVARLSYSAFWLFLLAALAGMLIGLLISAFGPGEPWNRIALLAGAVPIILPCELTIGHQAAGYVVLGLLLAISYWRGLITAQEAPDLNETRGRFGRGFAILFLGFICLIARGVVSDGPIWHILVIDGIAYTVLAMIAMVATRADNAREPGSGPAIVLAVSLQLGLLVLLALAAVQVFSVDLAGQIGKATQPFWDAVGAAAFNVVLLLAKPIDWLVGLIRPHPHPLVRTTVAPPPASNPVQHKLVHPHDTGHPLVVAIGLTLLALILAVLGYGIYRALPRISRHQPEGGFAEVRQSVWSASELWQALLAWLRAFGSRSVAAATSTVQRTRRRVFGEYPEDPVRRLYAQLLRRAAANGLPRPAYITPGEYQMRLSARWPDGAAHFVALTDAYELRRYGDVSLARLPTAALRAHWQGARVTIRRQRPITSGEADTLSLAVPADHTIPGWRSTLHRAIVAGRVALLGDRDLGLVRSIFLLITCFVLPIVTLAGIIFLLTVLGGH